MQEDRLSGAEARLEDTLVHRSLKGHFRATPYTIRHFVGKTFLPWVHLPPVVGAWGGGSQPGCEQAPEPPCSLRPTCCSRDTGDTHARNLPGSRRAHGGPQEYPAPALPPLTSSMVALLSQDSEPWPGKEPSDFKSSSQGQKPYLGSSHLSHVLTNLTLLNEPFSSFAVLTPSLLPCLAKFPQVPLGTPAGEVPQVLLGTPVDGEDRRPAVPRGEHQDSPACGVGSCLVPLPVSGSSWRSQGSLLTHQPCPPVRVAFALRPLPHPAHLPAEDAPRFRGWPSTRDRTPGTRNPGNQHSLSRGGHRPPLCPYSLARGLEVSYVPTSWRGSFKPQS